MIKYIKIGKNNIRAKRAIILFFLFILVILLVVVLAIHTSRIGIKIENLKIDTEQPKGEKVNKDSKIIVYLLIFKKFKLFKKDVKSIDKRKIKIPQNMKIKIDYKEVLPNIDIDVEQIDLNVQLGIQDAALTAILTGIISAGLGVILRKPKYEVIPIYSDKNFLKIKLDCIISVYLMQYIYKLISNKIKDLRKEALNKKAEV